MENKQKEIRAVFDDETITVYQAYRKEIALPAVKHQRFVAPFKMDRMTWIKPSFLWMMYRCGWTQKEGQEHVLSIRIKRSGLEWALNHACLSHFDATIHDTYDSWKAQLHRAPVRIQWDPERNLYLEKLDYRSIQIGLSEEAVTKYVQEWIVSIEDISDVARKIDRLKNTDERSAMELLPKEKRYPLELPKTLE